MNDVLDYLELATQLVGVFAIIATMTPNPKDDEYAKGAERAVNKIWQAVNMLGANVGKAKNGP